jgi:hypothetical protein
MKLYTPEKTELMEVTAIRPERNGLVIEGKIMGAMPMKAFLRPRELRGAFKLVHLRIVLTLLAMLFRRDE